LNLLRENFPKDGAGVEHPHSIPESAAPIERPVAKAATPAQDMAAEF
jgi:hypothetical protein